MITILPMCPKPEQPKNTAERISQKIEATFTPATYKLINDSHKHAPRQHADESGAERQTHFTLILVSSAFANTELVRRHRLVYAALANELGNNNNGNNGNGMHALSLHLYTPEEWQELSERKKKDIGIAPPCISRR